MNCKTFDERLEAFLSGDLAPFEQAEAEEHRATCAYCQSLVERATRMDDLLRSGLTSAAAMTAGERATLREAVLSKGRHPLPRRDKLPRLAVVASALAAAIVVSLGLLWARSVPAVSAAEILTRAQDAMEGRADLSGVLHWETSLEQWAPGPSEPFAFETEIWFDFDDPGRYRLHHQLEGEFAWGEVRNGVDRYWKFADYPNAYVDEFILSPKEMRQMTEYLVPSPFRDELDRFSDILSDVKMAGESKMAGRRVYLLRGELPTMQVDRDGKPDTAIARVTLFVDAETYWLLGREEFVKGEDRPRMRYQTVRFDLVAPDQVSETTFTFTPPEGTDVRQIDGLELGYQNLTVPHMTLEEAAESAPFTLLLPTTLPTDLRMRPVASIESFASASMKFTQVYEDGIYGWMVLSEYEGLIHTGLASKPVEIGGKQGWVEHDLIYSDAFTVYLLSPWEQDETTADSSLPGSVVLAVRGYSLNEAIAVLESLEPYTP